MRGLNNSGVLDTILSGEDTDRRGSDTFDIYEVDEGVVKIWSNFGGKIETSNRVLKIIERK